MTWLDYAVLGVLAASIVWGAWRGLVREIAAILGWVVAFLSAGLFAGPLAPSMPAWISVAEMRMLASYLAVFLGTLAITTVLGLVLSRLAKVAGFGGFDRSLGAVFGIARGMLVSLVFGLVAGLTSLPRDTLWQDSVCGPALAQLVIGLKPWLPPSLADRLRYD
ncbi:MAG: CvpA family protein [Betaproteobacteria bacterium]|nr:CvpA family protein [Betaproteobacteria bacterium]